MRGQEDVARDGSIILVVTLNLILQSIHYWILKFDYMHVELLPTYINAICTPT